MCWTESCEVTSVGEGIVGDAGKVYLDWGKGKYVFSHALPSGSLRAGQRISRL